MQVLRQQNSLDDEDVTNKRKLHIWIDDIFLISCQARCKTCKYFLSLMGQNLQKMQCISKYHRLRKYEKMRKIQAQECHEGHTKTASILEYLLCLKSCRIIVTWDKIKSLNR
jgi:hypothetical protein